MHCEFPDDTKLRGAVDTLIGRGLLWGDVAVLEKWAITKHMKFLTRATARFSGWDRVILVKNTNWGMRAGEQPCGIRSQRLGQWQAEYESAVPTYPEDCVKLLAA